MILNHVPCDKYCSLLLLSFTKINQNCRNLFIRKGKERDTAKTDIIHQQPNWIGMFILCKWSIFVKENLMNWIPLKLTRICLFSPNFESTSEILMKWTKLSKYVTVYEAESFLSAKKTTTHELDWRQDLRKFREKKYSFFFSVASDFIKFLQSANFWNSNCISYPHLDYKYSLL